jgi:CRP-like cAMP-binding protein
MNSILDKNAIVERFLKNLKIKLFFPEEQIIRQNEPAKSMFFIVSGEFEVFVLDEDMDDKYASTLRGGDYFGEVALLKNCLRTASVYGKDYST